MQCALLLGSRKLRAFPRFIEPPRCIRTRSIPPHPSALLPSPSPSLILRPSPPCSVDSPRGNSISRISINFRCWHSNCVLLGQHVIRFCRPADSCGLVRRSRCVAAGLTRWRKAGVAQQASSWKGKTGFLLLFTGQLPRPAVPGAVWGQCLAAQALASFVDRYHSVYKYTRRGPDYTDFIQPCGHQPAWVGTGRVSHRLFHHESYHCHWLRMVVCLCSMTNLKVVTLSFDSVSAVVPHPSPLYSF